MDKIQLCSRVASGSSTDCASVCSNRDSKLAATISRKRTLLPEAPALRLSEDVGADEICHSLKRRKSSGVRSRASSSCSTSTDVAVHMHVTATSVGKCPPRDMKRLKVGTPYKVTRVAKWGEKLALFLQSTVDEKETGFFKPPAQNKNDEFHVGDKVRLEAIGYSASRNRIAQKISVDHSEAMCIGGCEGKYGPEGGCCTKSVVDHAAEKPKGADTRKAETEPGLSPDLAALVRLGALQAFNMMNGQSVSSGSAVSMYQNQLAHQLQATSNPFSAMLQNPLSQLQHLNSSSVGQNRNFMYGMQVPRMRAASSLELPIVSPSTADMSALFNKQQHQQNFFSNPSAVGNLAAMLNQNNLQNTFHLASARSVKMFDN